MDRGEGRIAVVTGGGGSNIGRSVSRRLAAVNERVVVVDKDTTAGTETVDLIESEDGNDAVFLECDVTVPDAVSSVLDSVVAEFGSLDVLVNNAGGASGLRLEDIDEATFDDNVDVNLKSAFFTTRAALPHLRDGDGGNVVFVSSINALLGGFSEVAYSVSKAGLHALARCLTADYAGDGVRFNVVCPGSVIGNSDTWEERERRDPGTKRRIHELYPVGRYGDPEDVAAAVEFLSSPRASWISGVTLPVDGGLTATGGLPGGRWWENI